VAAILWPVVRRLLLSLAVVAVVLLAGCRLDVVVDLQLGADGTGALSVTATVDPEVVRDAPGLADDLRFDDAVALGWVVDGPTPTEDGGLTVTLRHPVTSADDATNLLAGLGPPFVDVRLERTTAAAAADGDGDGGGTPDEATTTMSGRLELAAGFDSFADADLLAATGATPYAEQIAAADATPSTSLSIVFRAALPGEVESTTGETDDGALQWDAPLDGSAQDLATVTAQRPAGGGAWARPLSWFLLALFVLWVVLAVVLIIAVARARRARAARWLRYRS